MNWCALGESSKPPRSQEAQTTPPAAPENPTSPSDSPQRAQDESSGLKPAASASLSLNASAVAWPAAPSTSGNGETPLGGSWPSSSAR